MKVMLNNELHEKCEGCGNIIEKEIMEFAFTSPENGTSLKPTVEGAQTVKKMCRVLATPAVQWTRIKGCHMRTHDKPEAPVESKKINPLKASRRSKKAR
jgi:hypothetical protein